MGKELELIQILQQYALDIGCTNYLHSPGAQRTAVSKLQSRDIDIRLDELDVVASEENETGVSGFWVEERRAYLSQERRKAHRNELRAEQRNKLKESK